MAMLFTAFYSDGGGVVEEFYSDVHSAMTNRISGDRARDGHTSVTTAPVMATSAPVMATSAPVMATSVSDLIHDGHISDGRVVGRWERRDGLEVPAGCLQVLGWITGVRSRY